MKIKILACLRGATISLDAGSIADVDDSFGVQLIKVGAAEEIKELEVPEEIETEIIEIEKNEAVEVAVDEIEKPKPKTKKK
jgi:hypothetical protein